MGTNMTKLGGYRTSYYLKIAIYSLLALLVIDNILIYSGKNPIISNLNPIFYLLSISTTFIVPTLLTIKLILLIIKKDIKSISILLTIVIVSALSIVYVNSRLRREAIADANNVVDMILSSKQPNDSTYSIIVNDKTAVYYNLFKSNYDPSAVKLYSALTQYKRYEYIIMPNHSSIKPFMITIQKNDDKTQVIINNDGIETYMQNYKRRNK
jgi:hypothetical protein